MKLGVSIDGFPYFLATAGVTALPTVATGYEADWSTAWTLAQGFLDAPKGYRWSERMAPVDGELQVDGINFLVHDGKVSSGPAAGQHLMTYMTTRSKRVLTSTVLTSTLLAGDGLGATFDVGDGSSFPSGDQVVWLGTEAIRCSARAADTFTITTRGYYGTRAQTWPTDADASIFPPVYGDFPGVARRRCVLWWVHPTTNVATPLWRGRLDNAAPRLNADGARFELPAQHVSKSELQRTIGDPTAVCRLRGYSEAGCDLTLMAADAAFSWTGLGATRDPTRVYRTLREVFEARMAALPGLLAADSRTSGITVQQQSILLGRGVTYRATTTGTSRLRGVLTFGFESWRADSTETADPRRVEVQTNFVPECMVAVETSASRAVPVDSVQGFPAAWTPTAYADGPGGRYATQITPVLRGEYDEQTWMVLEPSAHDDDDASLAGGGPSVTARARFEPRTDAPATVPRSFEALESGEAGRLSNLRFVDRRVQLRSAIRVHTGHWAYGLQRALEYTDLRAGHDTRNWSWATADAVAAATGAGVLGARDWTFSGDKKVQDVLRGLFALAGCGLAIRAGGCMGPVAFRRALANEAVTVALTDADLVKTVVQTYSVLRDGIANVARVATTGVVLTVREAGSIAEHEEARTVEVELTGVPIEQELLANYRRFASEICSRILYLWNQPLAVVTVPVNLSKLFAVYTGDIVSISESLLPNGVGSRGVGSAAALAALGINAQYGFVLGREVDLGAGVVNLSLLLAPVAFGYSPACKVASRAGLRDLTVATAFFNGNDFTGANSADGGASKFLAGDRVELRTYDSTTYTAESHTVASVFGTTITLGEDLGAGMQAAIDGGDFVVLVYDDYATAGLQSTQESYAWCADAIDIGGTGDRPQEWSP